MKKLFKKLICWFDLNLSWFVVNGRKQEEHAKRLKEKYNKGNQINGSTEYYQNFYDQMREREK